MCSSACLERFSDDVAGFDQNVRDQIYDGTGSTPRDDWVPWGSSLNSGKFCDAESGQCGLCKDKCLEVADAIDIASDSDCRSKVDDEVCQNLFTFNDQVERLPTLNEILNQIGTLRDNLNEMASLNVNANRRLSSSSGPLPRPERAFKEAATRRLGERSYKYERHYETFVNSQVKLKFFDDQARARHHSIPKSSAVTAQNVLCKLMKGIVRHATGADSALDGDTLGNYQLDSGFDFECCQCYLSRLPETGHTDDVQLGALGANDDYGSNVPAPGRRRRTSSDVTTTPLQRAEHRQLLREQKREQKTAITVDEACAICADASWVEALCAEINVSRTLRFGANLCCFDETSSTRVEEGPRACVSSRK